jgi:hypothetical protein
MRGGKFDKKELIWVVLANVLNIHHQPSLEKKGVCGDAE